jgi:hypothetical protein
MEMCKRRFSEFQRPSGRRYLPEVSAVQSHYLDRRTGCRAFASRSVDDLRTDPEAQQKTAACSIVRVGKYLRFRWSGVDAWLDEAEMVEEGILAEVSKGFARIGDSSRPFQSGG